jgi:hypothetical protein
MNSPRFWLFLLAALLCDGPGAAPQLLPDQGGTLASVAISVNSARRAALRNAELATKIVNGLPETVRFAILTSDLAAFTVTGEESPQRIRFLELPFANPITIWTQDPFLVLRDAEKASTILLTSKDFERADDRLMAAEIARANGFEMRVSELYFEGGNIVSDEDTIFIGANTIRYDAIELGLSEADVVRAFQKELGRRVLVIGPLPQPVAHIDMMMTPLGNGTVALADAALGADLAERALRDDPESVAAFERHSEDYFFGHPSIREVRALDGKRVSAPRVRGRTQEMIERSRSIAPALDGIARALEAHNYKVVRVPFLDGGPAIGDLSPNGGEATADYPMLTYNNVLLESDNDRRIVYLPGYGWPAMDRAAERTWQAMGYETRVIDGLTASAMYGGALRCSVKVLERNGF